MFLDCCTLMPKEKGGKKATKNVWRMVVFQSGGLKMSDMFPPKNGMVEPALAKMCQMQQEKVLPKWLRVDNARENNLLATRMVSDEWKINVIIELTARDTPQQNSPVEVRFVVIGNRAGAMMIAANVPSEFKHLLFPEAVRTATLLDGLVPLKVEGRHITRHEHILGKLPAFVQHLRTWGEAGAVKIKARHMHPKVEPKGATCMLVGYAEQHAGDCHGMWDPKTKQVHATRDVIWLRRMCFPRKTGVPTIDMRVATDADEVATQQDGEGLGADCASVAQVEELEELDVTNKNDAENIEEAIEPVDDAEGEPNPVDESEDEAEEQLDDEPVEELETTTTTRTGRTVRTNCNANFACGVAAASIEHLNQTCGNMQNQILQARKEIIAAGTGIDGGFTDTHELKPMKHDEAMRTPDEPHWEKAVDKEHDRMVTKSVFKAIPKKDLPEGAKVLSTTWACKKKADGTHRARVNTRGFEQIDGIHCDENDKAAPAVSDITIRIFMVLIVMAAWFTQVVDVNGAFLLSDFKPEHEMHIAVPQLKDSRNAVLHGWCCNC